jgi:hypothetical protein
MSVPNLMPFQDLPFNGDTQIQKSFIEFRDSFKLNVAVETGSCLFSTTKWLGEEFERVFTVEISQEFATHGIHKISGMENVKSYVNMDSVHFLKEALNLNPSDRVIYFLDAHWGNHCPLLNEISAIAALKEKLNLEHPPVIAIHDFYTGNPEFGYDSYNGKIFDYDFIKAALTKVELAYGYTYKYAFNEIAEGAKRGIIYLLPEINYIS